MIWAGVLVVLGLVFLVVGGDLLVRARAASRCWRGSRPRWSA
ncbi:MAG: hypothetical protein R3F43_01730 [bacterium]